MTTYAFTPLAGPEADRFNLAHPVNRTESYPRGEADGSHLSELERNYLAGVPTTGYRMTDSNSPGWWQDTRTPGEKSADWTPAHLDHNSAVIVWRGEFGIQMGAVRSRTAAGTAGRTEDTYSASPFPGSWTEVPVSAILLVRLPCTI